MIVGQHVEPERFSVQIRARGYMQGIFDALHSFFYADLNLGSCQKSSIFEQLAKHASQVIRARGYFFISLQEAHFRYIFIVQLSSRIHEKVGSGYLGYIVPYRAGPASMERPIVPCLNAHLPVPHRSCLPGNFGLPKSRK